MAAAEKKAAEKVVEAKSADEAAKATTAENAADPAAGTEGRQVPASSAAAQTPRSASDALKESDEKVLTEQAAQRQTDAQRLSEAESNLNEGLIAREPEVVDSEDTITVPGGTTVGIVTVDSFSVLDENRMHNSFKRGDRVKIDKKSFERGVALGALKKP